MRVMSACNASGVYLSGYWSLLLVGSAIVAIQIRDVRNTANSIVRRKRHTETQPPSNRLPSVSSKDHSTSSPISKPTLTSVDAGSREFRVNP